MGQNVASSCIYIYTTRKTPDATWLFAQSLLGNTVQGTFGGESDERAERKQLEWLAKVSSEREEKRRSLAEQERHAKEERSRLE